MQNKMKRPDAVLITFQIVSLQCFYYAFMGLLYMGCHVIYGLPLSLDRFFSLDKNLDIFTESGGLEILSILASALIGAYLLRSIVEKSRKCLDFSVTLFAVHFVTCVVYSRFVMPSLTWWVVHLVALVVMVVLGAHVVPVCMRYAAHQASFFALDANFGIYRSSVDVL